VRMILFGWICLAAAQVIGAQAVARSDSNDFGPLVNLNEKIKYPSNLVQGHDGSFYFLAMIGEDRFHNAVFSISPSGQVRRVYKFTDKDGSEPSGLMVASDGNLYGTLRSTNADIYATGSIFELTPAGKFTTVHRFTGDDGSSPSTGVDQARDGSLYGTTSMHGGGVGTVFKMTLAGQMTTLHVFKNGSDGLSPRDNPIEGHDGNIYGTTPFSAVIGGSIFRVTPSGEKTTIYQFRRQDGEPSVLRQGRDGFLYGTLRGDTSGYRGAAFKMRLDGVLTTMHSFRGWPSSGFVQDGNGNLYGTTEKSEAEPTVAMASDGHGHWVPLSRPAVTSDESPTHVTLYRIDPSGRFNTIHVLDSTEGSTFSGLMVGKDGNLYGTTDTIIFRLGLDQPKPTSSTDRADAAK
jgi:uncharacterized repeat protein (TIGR03803 family)